MATQLLSFRIDAALRARLERDARLSRRSVRYPAQEAIKHYFKMKAFKDLEPGSFAIQESGAALHPEE